VIIWSGTNRALNMMREDTLKMFSSLTLRFFFLI
jgi:hypothetical protein